MKFQLLWQLEPGGYGDVWVGLLCDTQEYVVVKFLRDPHLPQNRRAFAREVRLLSRRLRGLVTIIFADINGQVPYYVMPYLNRGTLTQYAGRLTDNQLLGVAAELASTLANMHAINEVHGDTKPDNILVNCDGHLQLADPLGNGTLVTMLFSPNGGGTPGYCAPEIVNGGPVSKPGDVFSFGATLYHLQTGTRPRPGQRLDPAAEGYENAPKISEIIAVCCQADPAARPTMQEVLRMLGGASFADIRVDRARTQAVGAAFLVGATVVLAAIALSAQ